MIDKLLFLSDKMSFSLSEPERRHIGDSRGGTAFVQAISQAVADTNPQIVVCIIPKKKKDIYDAIKRKCCTEYGVPSQVVTSQMVSKANRSHMSVITKIAIQMSCKLGGVPWALEIPVIRLVLLLLFFNVELNSKYM